jgi:hypothetical protein
MDRLSDLLGAYGYLGDPQTDAAAGQSLAALGRAFLQPAITIGEMARGIRPYDRNAATDAATEVALNRLPTRVPVAQGEQLLGSMPIRAYHGSPHDFDRFDISRIGTGEGAQAYGHGLYFAENEGVARAYRDALSAPKLNPLSPDYLASRALTYAQNDPGNAVQRLRDQLGEWRSSPPSFRKPGDEQRFLDAISLIKGGQPIGQGRMYEVGIHADPERFLDWDRPVIQQPDVAKVLGSLGYDAESAAQFSSKPPTGATVYKAWEPLNQAKATEEFRAAGIPGIKYLDQGSRGAGTGSRNYVTFSDDIVEILRKYGLAGLGAGLPAFAAAQQGGMLSALGPQRQLVPDL